MLLVTGGGGFIGSRIVRHLRAAGTDVAALVRDAAKARNVLSPEIEVKLADYEDAPRLTVALQGVEELVVVPSDEDGPTIMRHIDALFRTAEIVGVSRVILLSIVDVDADSPFYFAPVYRHAEAHLRRVASNWTILRCGLYSDFLASRWLDGAARTGVLSVPAGKGRVSLVSRETIALAAAAAIRSKQHRGKICTLTGPAALSFEEIARIASERYGTKIGYQPCAPADYLLELWRDLRDPWPHAFSTLFASIQQGRYERVTDDVEHLTGRSAESLVDTLMRSDKDILSKRP